MSVELPVAQLITVTGVLHATSDLRIGAAAPSGTEDLDLVRLVDGRPVIPGTTLAGAARSALRRAIRAAGTPPELVTAWARAFGEEERDGPALIAQDLPLRRDEEAPKSQMGFDDAPLVGNADEMVRDHVAIDLSSHTALDRAKHDELVLARGARFEARMTLTIRRTATASDDETLFAWLCQLLAAGDLRLGAKVTSGLGRVKLEQTFVRREDFGTQEDTLLAVGRRLGLVPREETSLTAVRLLPALGRGRIEIVFEPLGSLTVRAGHEGAHVKMLPLTTQEGDDLRLIVPGTSLKGALRAHADLLVRTAAQASPAPADQRRSDLPLVDALFGAAAESDAADDATGGRGVAAVDDCLGATRFREDDWLEVVEATTTPTAQAAARNVLPHAVVRPHVAIDRWTGGVFESALYTVLETREASWSPIVLEVDADRIEGDQRLAAGALLLLIMRDLASGDLPLGGLVNRGHGHLKRVSRIRIRGLEPLGFDDDQDFDPAGYVPTDAMRAAWVHSLSGGTDQT